MKSRFIAHFAVAFLITAAAFAQDAPPARPVSLHALVETFDSHKLEVKIEGGKELSVTVPDTVHVTRSRDATVAEIKSGQFIGCTAVEGPDGKLRAEEIHIMPEAMRGAGGGHYPWGSVPRTTMTNGNVEEVSGVTDGQTIKVSYKGGQSVIEIPRDVRVTVIEPASMEALKSGSEINLYAQESPPGTWTALYIGLAK